MHDFQIACMQNKKTPPKRICFAKGGATSCIKAAPTKRGLGRGSPVLNLFDVVYIVLVAENIQYLAVTAATI